MRKLLRYILSIADNTGLTPRTCTGPLFDWAGLQPWAGKIVLGRLIREHYVTYFEADICDEHQDSQWRYRLLPHVIAWLNDGAPHPGPPPQPTIVIQCPPIFVTIDEPDLFERN